MSGVMAAPAHADAGPSERAAARRASRWVDSLEALVLGALCHAEETGLTVHEALRVLGMPERKRYSVAPRLSVLYRHRGWAEPTGEERDDCQVYRVTEAGLAHARTEGVYA
jgi:DNA-binding PadR family transcriptional regulator